MNFINSFSDFWEILTGVIDDNKAKIIRFTCFFLLILGIGWAAFNYFRANLLSNTDINALSHEHYVPPNDWREYERIANLAKTVEAMRDGGVAIARQMTETHSRPFNITGEKVVDNTASFDLALSFDKQQNVEDNSTEIFVRAIMTTGKTRAAVLDAGEFKGLMVRQKTKLPGDFGQVTKITSDKIIVRRNRRNYEYPVIKIETNLERQLAGKSPNAPNSNASRPGQTQMGVEQFVFEGTVPENSPLTTSVKEEELKK